MTAPPPRVAEAAEPDVEYTVVPNAPPPLDPHMWPTEAPPAVSTGSTTAVPQFHGFRIGNSQIVLLDAIAYVGRKPSTPRVVRGGVPRLVRVQSPTQEVSSTHLELRQVGASVIVSDLRSTNGSVVMIPGSVPRKLRQGESVVVSPGTLVDIGDGNILQVLPMQRRAWPAERQP